MSHVFCDSLYLTQRQSANCWKTHNLLKEHQIKALQSSLKSHPFWVTLSLYPQIDYLHLFQIIDPSQSITKKVSSRQMPRSYLTTTCCKASKQSSLAPILPQFWEPHNQPSLDLIVDFGSINIELQDIRALEDNWSTVRANLLAILNIKNSRYIIELMEPLILA